MSEDGRTVGTIKALDFIRFPSQGLEESSRTRMIVCMNCLLAGSMAMHEKTTSLT